MAAMTDVTDPSSVAMESATEKIIIVCVWHKDLIFFSIVPSINMLTKVIASWSFC